VAGEAALCAARSGSSQRARSYTGPRSSTETPAGAGTGATGSARSRDSSDHHRTGVIPQRSASATAPAFDSATCISTAAPISRARSRAMATSAVPMPWRRYAGCTAASEITRGPSSVPERTRSTW
jgi:hypothetical protein